VRFDAELGSAASGLPGFCPFLSAGVLENEGNVAQSGRGTRCGRVSVRRRQGRQGGTEDHSEMESRRGDLR